MKQTSISYRVALLAALAAPVAAAGVYSLALADDAPKQRHDARLALLQAAPAPAEAEGDGAHHGNWWHAPGGVRKMAAATDCLNCHNKADLGAELPAFVLGAGGVDDGWALLNEFRTWVKEDKHRQAWFVLLNERSQQMAKLLNVVDEQGNSLIHLDQRCLACHSSVPLESLEADGNGLISADAGKDGRITAGVSCEGCHGPSLTNGDATGWNEIHRRKDEWRFLSPHEKFSEYGYWDVRSPVTKTKICLSCHLGNVEQGKIVTHEMYAAGHPPLPGFEIETFIDQEPQHWRDFGAKSEEVRTEFLEKTGTTYDPETLHKGRGLLVGSLVNLSETLRLSADMVHDQVESPVAKPEWPELANFACYGCHHDLKVPAWRQQRELVTVPGRPLFHEWSMALVEVAALAGDVSPQEFEQRMRPVWAALSHQPFGMPSELQSAAREAADWADSVARRLEQKEYTEQEGWETLHAISEIASTRKLDYDSARQLVWAFHVVYSDLQDAEAKEPGVWKGWYAEESGLDPVEQVLASLDTMFILDLRAGRERKQEFGGREESYLEVDLSKSLPITAAYEPAEFQAAMQKLGNLVQQARGSKPRTAGLR